MKSENTYQRDLTTFDANKIPEFRHKTNYRQTSRIIGSNLKNINSKSNIYNLIACQFNNSYIKKEDKSDHLPSKSFKQTKNIFYVKFTEKTQTKENTGFPLLSKSSRYNRDESDGYVPYTQQKIIVDDQSRSIDAQAYKNKKSERMRSKSDPLKTQRMKGQRNCTRYGFNNKRQFLVNPELGYMILHNKPDQLQKRIGLIDEGDSFKTQLNGTQKQMMYSPQKRRHCLKYRRIHESKKLISHKNSTMTGLLPEQLKSKSMKQKKNELFSPWSIEFDEEH